jgi:hypothetical protein
MNLARAHHIEELNRTTAERLAAEREAEERRLASQKTLTPAEHAAQRAERARQQREREAERDLARVRADHHRRYVAAGGTETGFAAAWPGLLEEHLRNVAAGKETPPANPLADPKRWGLSR